WANERSVGATKTLTRTPDRSRHAAPSRPSTVASVGSPDTTRSRACAGAAHDAANNRSMASAQIRRWLPDRGRKPPVALISPPSQSSGTYAFTSNSHCCEEIARVKLAAKRRKPRSVGVVRSNPALCVRIDPAPVDHLIVERVEVTARPVDDGAGLELPGMAHEHLVPGRIHLRGLAAEIGQ